jgi:SAM-dependent methyltransferase
MIRTYLHTKVKFINEVLYIYRITGENTWIERNQKIQTGTVQIYHENAYKLAERWADLEGLEKIDLGGGFNSPVGYKSVDLKNADIICDISKGLPFEDNSVGVVRAHDILEHLQDKEFLMSEIYCVLADGGWLLASVPSTDGRGAWQDPTHVSFWNENSFWYWTRAEQAKYIYNEKVRFQEFRLETIFPSEWHRKNNISYVVANLVAIKSDKRKPHLKLI